MVVVSYDGEHGNECFLTHSCVGSIPSSYGMFLERDLKRAMDCCESSPNRNSFSIATKSEVMLAQL